MKGELGDSTGGSLCVQYFFQVMDRSPTHYMFLSPPVRQVNEVNGGDTVFVRCVCVCLCTADRSKPV